MVIITPQSKSTVRVSFTMDNVSELDMLLSQTPDVAENRNVMKIISQLPLFLYLVDGKFIPQEILSQVEKKLRVCFFLFPKLYYCIMLEHRLHVILNCRRPTSLIAIFTHGDSPVYRC